MKFQVSTFWQSATMAVILWSFIEAFHYGSPSALQMWTEGWEGMAALLLGGVGMKMTAQSVERIAERKYNRRPSGLPDGES